MSKNLSYLSEYSSFQSTTELNEAIESHFDRCRYDLNATDRDVMLMLSRYSVKYNGVAHLKNDTIAKAIRKSNRTVQRSIRKLERLLIIEKRPFLRKISGGFGANIYVILSPNVISEVSPREDYETPTDSSEKVEYTSDEPINLLSEKDVTSNTFARAGVSSNKPAYRRFKDAVIQFIGQDDKGTMYRLYGVYLAQTKTLRKAYDDSELIDVALKAVRATFHATKTKGIRNITGYFNGVISNMLDELGSELMAELWTGSVD